jgi:hypothetical protein
MIVPIRSPKHPGAIFIAERRPGSQNDRFIAKVYPGPNAEREATRIMVALRDAAFGDLLAVLNRRCGASPDCTEDNPCALHRLRDGDPDPDPGNGAETEES